MSDNDNGADDSVGRTRGRRSRTDRSGRSDALERLKNVRAGGGKHKYEVQEVQNVYDIVDESTYSRRVTDRQKDDWIVDDGTGDYVEDGREIFDDDINDRDEENERKKPKSKKEKAAKKAETEMQKAGFANVRDMLCSMPIKRKRPEESGGAESVRPQFSGNDLLAEVMGDLKIKKDGPRSSRPAAGFRNTEEECIAVSEMKGPSMKTEPKKSKLDRFEEMGRNIPAKRARYTIKKKVFVPFGSSSTEPASSSIPSSFEHDDPPHLDDQLDMDFCEPPPRQTAPASTSSNGNAGTTTGTSASSKVKTLSVPSVPVTNSKPKRHETITDSFQCSGHINNGSTTLEEQPSFGFEDSTPTLFEEGPDSKILNFFWLDMFEEPRNPGVLYVFGKVESGPGNYSSACVVVKDLCRSVHLLIRETMKSDEEVSVTGVDVYNEFNQVIAPKFKINEFKSRPVDKLYCFDNPHIPTVGKYIEVRYSGSLPPLPADLEGETFSHIFGAGNPLMENFLLDKKLKGPSWLQIRNPVEVQSAQRHSWCKFEFSCSVGDVRLNDKSHEMKIPTVVLASVNILTASDAESKRETIIFAGVAVHKGFELDVPLNPSHLYHNYFCLVTTPASEIWPLDVDEAFSPEVSKNNATKMDSERALLACLLAKLQQIDADIYLGHDLNFELLLLHLLNLKVQHWSRLGRLKRSNPTGKNGKTLDYKSVLAGRLLCDVKTSAMELIRARSYDFQNLTSQVLGVQTETLTGPEMKEQFGSAKGLLFLINWAMQHCVLNIRLVNQLQVLPLALQITAIAGNTLFRTLLGGRSERNEFLLLHAFHSKGYLVPDKYRPKKEEGDLKGPSYLGGMVLDPKKGFYDKFIVLMDFNSLYPSIIQEYNICFTTRGEAKSPESKGVLPEEIRKLVESRRQVKGLMKNPKLPPEQLRVYDIRQMALKLTANSMYGCLGFRNSRFYAKELAALITGHGRDILVKTKDVVERMGFEVIYGDTDSLMINSNTVDISKVFGIGNQIKTEVNKMYKLLELEVDGIFRFLLLLKKKKYAALVYTQNSNGESSTSLELKGLDMVRRDWAPIASNTARLVLEEIMSEQSLEEKVFKICGILNDVAQKLNVGNIQMKDLLITKQLAKHPEEYKDSQGGLYHVQVALRMNNKGTLPKKFRNGDTVPYLFCTDGLPRHLSELSAISEGEEMEQEGKLLPDPKYYLAHQIHPVVSRICEPIEGLDPARIAEELGMDSSSFKRRRLADEQEDKSLGQQTEAEKYVDCEKFTFNCPHSDCGKAFRYESMFCGKDADITFAMMKCPECDGSLVSFGDYILNSLCLFLRKFTTKFYLSEYICEDPTCDNVERCVPFSLVSGYPPCVRCGQGLMVKDYNESHLYKQFLYLHNLFHFDKQLETRSDKEKGFLRQLKQQPTPEVSAVLGIHESLQSLMSQRLQSSGYSEIKLSTLFHDLYPPKTQLLNFFKKKSQTG